MLILTRSQVQVIVSLTIRNLKDISLTIWSLKNLK